MHTNPDFSKLLVLWYLNNKRDLPWRNTKDPYFIWLSEIILQQTKIVQGQSYYLKFKKHFKNIFLLAEADEKEVLKLWQGLGYYSRARNLHETAKFVAKELNGYFPDNYSDLLKLKGIGDYTASAIASICFNKPEATVDGNVFRVLSRYFGIFHPINSSHGKKEFKKLAQLLIDPDQPGEYNQALMEFGALMCKPKNPNCLNCNFKLSCFAFGKKKIHSLPVKTNTVKIKKRFFNYIILNVNNRSTYIAQRTKNDIWKNLYEFPLFETSNSIGLNELLKTDLFNSLVKQNPYQVTRFNSKEIVHKLTHQHLYTSFWIVDINTSVLKEYLWEDLFNFPVPTLIQNFVDKYRNRELSYL